MDEESTIQSFKYLERSSLCRCSACLWLCSLSLISLPLFCVGHVRVWVFLHLFSRQRSSRASEGHILSVNNSGNSLFGRTLKETKEQVFLDAAATWGLF